MRTCLVSIDVERDPAPEQARYGAGNFGDKNTYKGVENLDNILDIFKKHKISATLFISGQVLEHFPDLVKKWAKNYEIGCHNYNHQYLDELDLLERERQLKKFVEVYRTILEKFPKGFRAPRNIIDNEQFPILRRYGFLYDSSVLPRYPWPIRRYEGYKGRAPILPYFPNEINYRKKGKSGVLEIPESPVFLVVPFSGTWLRKLGVSAFKAMFRFTKPKFISFSMHSWDGVEFQGGKNSGEKFLKQLDEMLGFLKKIGYEFKSGEQILHDANMPIMTKFKKIENKEETKKLLDRVLFKTFFHSLEWHNFLEKEFKWLKFEYYLYNNEILLSLGRVKTCLPAGRLISLPFCEYGGPLPLQGGIDIDAFEKDVLEEFKNIKIKFHPKILNNFTSNVEPQIPNPELRTSNILTYWIENLKNISEQGLLASFRKTLRHEIRNAKEHNLEIKKCDSLKDLKRFYSLYAANLKRKKTVPYPFSVIKFLYEQPDTEILLALHSAQGRSASGGKIIAGSMFLNYSGFVHYFLSASDYKYRDFGANYLILWEKIKSLIGKDIILDLGASPRGSKLEIFKRGWGGKEYPIYQIGIKRTPASAKATAGRDESFLRSSKLIRGLWSLLPSFVIKKLSSKLIKYRL